LISDKRGSRKEKQDIQNYTQYGKKTPDNKVHPVPADGKDGTHQDKNDENINKVLTGWML
jgi:hypothetical protein